LFKTASRDLVLLLVLMWSALLCETSIYVLVPLAANARQASNFWVGVLAGTPQLMLVLGLIPGTAWVASWRRRTVLALGAGLQGASALGHAVVADAYWMLLPQVALGLGLALFWPACLSYFASIVAGDGAHTMQGRRAAVEGLALLLAPLVATSLSQALGYSGGFGIIGALTVGVAVAVRLAMTRAARPADPAGARPDLNDTLHQARRHLKRPALLMILGLGCIAAVLLIQVGMPFLTLYLSSLGFGQASVGAFLSMISLSNITLQPAFGRLARRVRPIYLLVISIVGAAICFLLLPAFATPVLLAGLLLALGAVSSPYNPAMVSIVSGQFSDADRDLGIALWITTFSLALWLAAPALGALGDAAGLPALFPIAACLAIVGTVVLVQLGRRTARRGDAPQELVELWL
jgi:predicted MFS family arabinose efflux permease